MSGMGCFTLPSWALVNKGIVHLKRKPRATLLVWTENQHMPIHAKMSKLISTLPRACDCSLCALSWILFLHAQVSARTQAPDCNLYNSTSVIASKARLNLLLSESCLCWLSPSSRNSRGIQWYYSFVQGMDWWQNHDLENWKWNDSPDCLKTVSGLPWRGVTLRKELKQTAQIARNSVCGTSAYLFLLLFSLRFPSFTKSPLTAFSVPDTWTRSRSKRHSSCSQGTQDPVCTDVKGTESKSYETFTG